MKHQPLIVEVKGNALDDGPGIRSVVFFKGCPLACTWCHNPESQSTSNEICFDKAVCGHNGDCVSVCPENALSLKNPFFVDRDKCTLCFKCTEVCPTGALRPAAHYQSVEDVVRQVLKDKPFYERSGGGVTLSGGEPTLFMEYASALLKRLKNENIHTLIETCGFFNLERFIESMLPHVDMIYFDLKLMDDDQHKKYCGVSNQRVLENFATLHELSKVGTFQLIPRTPLIPGITDGIDNLQAIARFLADFGIGDAQLLSYNPLWSDKNQTIGLKSKIDENSPLNNWMHQQKIDECYAVFRAFGINV